METLAEFWKSARERFTNPFAFSYIVAWFTYNWRITVALIFTDKLPSCYKNVFSYISDQSKGWDVWVCPLLIAVGYVVLIAFVRQVIDWLNVKFNKLGTKWVLAESKGGKVAIEKYMAERDKVLDMTKKLEDLFATETEKTTNFNQLTENYNQTSQQYIASQKANSELQAKLVIELERTKKLQETLNGVHDYSVIRGTWDVQVGDGLNAPYTSYRVTITDTNAFKYDLMGRESQIENIFYNRDTGALLFYRLDKAANQTFVYDLKVSTQHHLEGTENGIQIHFNRNNRR